MPYLLDIVWNEAILCTAEYPVLCENLLGAQHGIVHHSTRTANDTEAVKIARVSAMAHAYQVKFGEDPRRRCDEYSRMIWPGSVSLCRHGAETVTRAVSGVEEEEEDFDDEPAGAAVEMNSPEETLAPVGGAASGRNSTASDGVSGTLNGITEEKVTPGKASGTRIHLGRKRQRVEDASGAWARSVIIRRRQGSASSAGALSEEQERSDRLPHGPGLEGVDEKKLTSKGVVERQQPSERVPEVQVDTKTSPERPVSAGAVHDGDSPAKDALVVHSPPASITDGQTTVGDVFERQALTEEVVGPGRNAGDVVETEPPVGNGHRGQTPVACTGTSGCCVILRVDRIRNDVLYLDFSG